ncbi:bifunctional UDP-N-acetylglucosamine diphosphorylase/glucosamine-1-phosphate N-acetyltransferase GlmU [Helicobacter labetoulli]|uniref:bifunctional UDP-N-acetylglucosamine diphosphorylase/glucosamine-1-phosphate N-acetyltransferase GlmU n=1 Tax=Helicobacter labetoulli TaxID=2315333 RepID=UPI000EF6A443|nr:bifunctional UDP-N-acetylglucosamine diphosphorylase/glucosamine-1-phosphate N-acetyltransferase GlmU [Helicobacter labetoulli]
MSVSVVILAAGTGTRMKSNTPKVLHTLCGKAMLFYSIDEALNLSDDVHIVLFHQESLVREKIAESYPQAYENGYLHFHTQDYANYPGTGGAIMQGGSGERAKHSFAYKYDEMLILNGDMPLVRSQTLKQLCENPAKIVMSILHLENPNGYGRVVLEHNKVQKIIEQKDATQEELHIKYVNAGVYKIHKDILESYLPLLQNSNNQKEFYLTDVIFYAGQNSVEIAALQVEEEEFMGVNSKLQLSLAQEVILKRLRNAAMEEGVIMHLPHTIYIESGVKFSGECILEQGVQILGKCEIINSHIKAHSVVESSIIESSDIGPMAHIRPKSHLVHTHIGNFVETKASVLRGVKAGHLSYLGDCEANEGSNIGAGVITCNYDGKQKHKTIIGKNVFVGSDVQLVAPLEIGSNVLIGAGSTITKDLQDGDLALSRTPQKNINNGYYKFFDK